MASVSAPTAGQDDQPSVDARRRIGVACSRCRRRKIKCTGDPGDGSGCLACRSAGLDRTVCTFVRIGSNPMPAASIDLMRASSSVADATPTTPTYGTDTTTIAYDAGLYQTHHRPADPQTDTVPLDDKWAGGEAMLDALIAGGGETKGTSNVAKQYELNSRSVSRSESRSRSNTDERADALKIDDNEEVPLGEIAIPAELYRVRRGSWTLDKPRQRPKLEIPRDRAIIVRREQDGHTTTWTLHSITIQSPRLRELLKIVFADYPNLSTDLDDLTFDPPFHEFFFRWDLLRKLTDECGDEKTREHSNLLIDTLKGDIQQKVERAADLKAKGLVTYDYLWTLFPNEQQVYAESDDYDRLYRVESSSYDDRQGVFQLSVKYVDFDGKKLGWATSRAAIDAWRGVKKVADLPLYPSYAHEDLGTLHRRLEHRGQLFLQHCKFHYKQYSGYYQQYGGSFWGLGKQFLEKGRIIIDAKALSEQKNDYSPRLEPLTTHKEDLKRRDSSADLYDSRARRRRFYSRSRSSSSLAEIGQNDNTPDLNLPGGLVVYCLPLVRGFNLTTKKWAGFYVDRIQDIEWNVNAFDRLLLREQYKRMILAFLEGHLSSADGFDDIIRGKGQGFIMLLSGEPGVGKTLTAESVAEEMRRPLYTMNAGELGSYTNEIEESLQRILDLCAKWRAVLLMDECDVFLEERSAHDLDRNRLVSVFLRLLEYYKGVMLLTTNRPDYVDAAFQSRIHLSIKYPNLDTVSRKQIWRTFTSQQNDTDQTSGLSDEELDQLSKQDFNGREIKNIVRAARLIATKEKVQLSMEHLQTVIDVKTEQRGDGH